MADGGTTGTGGAWARVRARLRDGLPPDTWSWPALVASLAALAAAPVAWALLVFRAVPGCRELEVAASFAGSPARFAERSACFLQPGQGLGGYHRHLLVGDVVALAAAAVLVVLWRLWFPKAWITARFTALRPLVWLAPVAALADVAENVIQHASVGPASTARLAVASGLGRPVVIGTAAAHVLPVIAWVKTVAFAAVWSMTLFTLVAAFSRRRVTIVRHDGDLRPRQLPQGLGIACSGGGIRAASISLGALGVLERTGPDGSPLATRTGTQGILDRATYLASVSGGGYAAGAWRVARGTARPDPEAPPFAQRWPGGIVGSPDDYDCLPPDDYDSALPTDTPSLFRHLQQRREFLRTGRGGLSGSLVVAFAFLVVHLGLLAALVTAVAWPVGRLAETWFVFGEGSRAVAEPNVQLDLGWRLYGPAVVFAVAAAAVWVVTLVKWNTKARIGLRRAAAGLAGAAAVIGLLLVGIPVWLDAAYPWITDHARLSALAGLVSGGGAAATVVGLMRKVLGPKLARLGGLLLAAAAVLYGTVIAGMAALGTGLFGTGAFGHGWTGWFVLCALLVAGYLGLCPRWWSLHTLYRNRLRGAFVTTRDRAEAPRRLADAADVTPGVPPVFPMRQRAEPQLDAYAGAPGPTHLICCSAARNHRTSTGVKALSFVLSAEEAVLYDVDPARPDGRVRVSLAGAPVPVRAFRAPIRPWLDALGSPWATQAEGTVSAGISVSGAAFAPAMGRMDMGTTNALLAALNLRLGTWFPNPRYVPRERPPGNRVRYPWVRLSYVLKELFGMYDLVDHHLYVTDGGHRENLGLVELLRRRCSVMICVDASGDTPGSYTTLRQAADLARLEVGARIDLSPLRRRAARFTAGPTPAGRAPAPVTAAGDLLFDPPRMGGDAGVRPPTAHTLLPVSYVDADGNEEGTGVIVHLAPVLFDELDPELAAFSLQDELFPHYSTGDQFLTEIQFRHLVQFGQCATRVALADPAVQAVLLGALPTPAAAPARGGDAPAAPAVP